MLSYATEFPVDHRHSSSHFLTAVKRWVINSPHSIFSEKDLADIPPEGIWNADSGTEKIQIITTSATEPHSVAIRRLQSGDINWETTLVFSKGTTDTWVSIRISREASHPAKRLPPAKKPILVGSILDELGGALDGPLRVSRTPHHLTNSDVSIASKLIDGTAECHLPTVYISCGFDRDYRIDANALANDLAGMAHVVVEPNRAFSNRLRIDVKSENAYGGAIGIYWPKGQGRRSLFTPWDSDHNQTDLKRGVVEEIRTALLNRRPLQRCSWAGVQEEYSRTEYARLKSSGSIEVEKYTQAFDSEMNAVKERLKEAEHEIGRLQAEMRRYEAGSSHTSGLCLNLGTETDLYPGEILQFAVEAFECACKNTQQDSRREHVLKSLVLANTADKQSERFRGELKEVLRSYRSMDPKCQRALEALGFSISSEGKHHKLVFRDDDRYTFILPKSGGDFRGGLNSASDIAKRLF